MMNRSVKSISAMILASVLLCGCTGSPGTGGVGREDITSGDHIPGTSATPGTQDSTADTETSAPVNRDVRFSFLAAGDNIIHESVYVDAQNRAAAAASAGTYTGNYYFDEMYDGIRALVTSAGIAYVNQEAPIAGDSLGVRAYPAFNAPEEIGDALIRVGFDVVNIANNHMLDMDTSTRTGYKNTLAYWKTRSVTMIGGYESEADYDTIRIVEKDGVRIALLSYTYGTNEYVLSAASPGLVVPYIDDATITRHIAAARGQADLVFVSMHWGVDNGGTAFNNAPSDEQTRLAHLMADAGADAVIGMHPHVIQPIRWLDRADGGRTLVIYSLGNLLSTMLHSYNELGGIVTFDIVKKEGEAAHIEEPKMLPVMCHYIADASVPDSQDLPTRSGVQLYLLEDYTEQLASAHGSQLYGTFSLDTLYGYVKSTIDPEFLPDYMK